MPIRFILCFLVLTRTAASPQSPETTAFLRHELIYTGIERYCLSELTAARVKELDAVEFVVIVIVAPAVHEFVTLKLLVAV